MDLTTLERLPLWIGGKAVAGQTARFGEVANPAKGEVVPRRPRRSPRGARSRRCAARGS